MSVAAVQQQQQVSCKDIGPDWEEESYNSNKVSSGSNLYEVTGGFPSVQLQSNPSQDAIIRQITRIKKCVDNVLGWARTLLQLFHDTDQM